jgi:hypothetical protein
MQASAARAFGNPPIIGASRGDLWMSGFMDQSGACTAAVNMCSRVCMTWGVMSHHLEGVPGVGGGGHGTHAHTHPHAHTLTHRYVCTHAYACMLGGPG